MPSQTTSKKESRLIRKAEKALRRQAKDARLANSINRPERPIRISIIPSQIKEPRGTFETFKYKEIVFTWDISRADRIDMWSWGEPRDWSPQEDISIIKPHFRALENNTWQQIETMTYNGADGFRRHLNKYQKLGSICNEAQLRWMNLETLSQFEDLFRFRLGSSRRIWGIRIQHQFFMVWYERNHQICPSDRNK